MLTRLGLYVATSRDWYKKKKKSKIFRQHTHFQPVLWRRLMSEYSTCVGVPQMLQALKSITQVNVCVGVKAAITEISRCTADTDDVSDFLLSKVKEMSPVCAFFSPHLLSNPWPTNQSQVTATDGLQSAERRRGHRERGFGVRLILCSFSTRSVTPLHSKSVYWLVTNVHLIGLREKCEKLHKAGLTGHKSIKSKNLSLFFSLNRPFTNPPSLWCYRSLRRYFARVPFYKNAHAVDSILLLTPRSLRRKMIFILRLCCSHLVTVCDACEWSFIGIQAERLISLCQAEARHLFI